MVIDSPEKFGSVDHNRASSA